MNEYEIRALVSLFFSKNFFTFFSTSGLHFFRWIFLFFAFYFLDKKWFVEYMKREARTLPSINSPQKKGNCFGKKEKRTMATCRIVWLHRVMIFTTGRFRWEDGGEARYISVKINPFLCFFYAVNLTWTTDVKTSFAPILNNLLFHEVCIINKFISCLFVFVFTYD